MKNISKVILFCLLTFNVYSQGYIVNLPGNTYSSGRLNGNEFSLECFIPIYVHMAEVRDSFSPIMNAYEYKQVEVFTDTGVIRGTGVSFLGNLTDNQIVQLNNNQLFVNINGSLNQIVSVPETSVMGMLVIGLIVLLILFYEWKYS